MNPDSPVLMFAVNNLIDSCRDGAETFHAAAGEIQEPALHAVLIDFGDLQGDYSRELENMLFPEPNVPATQKESVHTLCVLHRSWLHFQIAVAGGNQDAILSECERQAQGIEDAYWKVLQLELPEEFAMAVSRHYGEIRGRHSHLRELENELGRCHASSNGNAGFVSVDSDSQVGV